MKKSTLVLFVALVFVLGLTACSSSEQEGDGQVAASNDGSFSQDGGQDFKDGQSTESQASSGDQPSDGAAAEQTPADQLAAGEQQPQEVTPQPDANQLSDGNLALDEQPKPDQTTETANNSGLLTEDELAMDTGEELNEFPDGVAAQQPEAAVAQNPTDAPAFQQPEIAPQETAPAVAAAPSAEEPKPAKFSAYQKIKEQPFTVAGTLLNRVYVARAGDTLAQVSDKIYGADRSKELKKWNPGKKSNLSAGDKIYYASSAKPDDQQMLTYYDEKGIAPQIYTTKEGDNLRKFAKELLGSADSWKEIYATNRDLESKGAVPAGLAIRYWPLDAGASSTMASAQLPNKEDNSGFNVPIEPIAPINQAPPVAVNPVAPTQQQPTPPVVDPSVAVSQPPVNPTPPVAMNEQAAPPMKPTKPQVKPHEPASEEDLTTSLLLGGVLVLAAVGGFMMLKKRKSAAQQPMDLSATQA